MSIEALRGVDIGWIGWTEALLSTTTAPEHRC
ncbi:MAG: hypothetical protein ACI868_001824 [Granulosicoccus sp.]|jgi:hypothetical protein